MITQTPEATDTVLDSRKKESEARDRAMEIIERTRLTCSTCGKGRSNPYRNYVNGKIEAGCVDGFHTGHLVPISQSSDWHNRREARNIRKALRMQDITDPLDLLVENIMDLARENSIDDARIFIKDRIVKDALKPLVVALLRAKTTIRQWNGIGLSGAAEQACWDAYQHSPEMKEINAAIELMK